jgi:crotonobetaine/carnitine-CoA ligase
VPDKPFLDVEGHVLTYREFDLASNRLARGLRRIGVQHGDRVSCLMDNAIDSVLGWFAVNKLGAVFVPVNTALHGDFLRHQLSDAGSAVIFVGSAYAERVLELTDELPALRTLVVSGEPPARNSRLQWVHFADLSDANADPVGTHPAPTDLAMLIYTSGTTGPSKGCMISHSYAVRAGRQMAINTCMTTNDVAWTRCPLLHAAAALGIVVNVPSVNGTAAIARKFSDSDLWPEIERTRATTVLLVSTMLTIIASP